MKRFIISTILCLMALNTSSCQAPYAPAYRSMEMQESAKTVEQRTESKEEPKEVKQQRLLPGYVLEKGKKIWGLMDSSGTFVVKPQYEIMSDLLEDRIYKFSKDGKIGFLGKAGEIKLEPSYSYITDFSESLAQAFKEMAGTWVIDQDGKVVFESKYHVGQFHDGLATVSKNVGSDYLYGYTDKTGKTAIEPQFEQAFGFKGGRALVKKKGGNYEIIDKTGKALKELNYKNVSGMQGDFLIYRNDSGMGGYIDYDGNEITAPLFKETEPFVDGYAVVAVASGSSDKKYGVIGKDGKYLIEPQYARMRYIGEGMFTASEKASFAYVDLFEKKAIVNKDGKRLTDFKYYDIGGFSNGLSSVSDGTQTYFVDNSGKVVESLPKVDGAGTMKITGDIVKAEADEQVFYLTKDGKLLWKPDTTVKLTNGAAVKSMKYRPDRGILIYYPEISNLPDKNVENSINKELRARYVRNNPVSTLEDGMLMEESNLNFAAFDNKDLLVLEKGGYYYSIGAAHPMQSRVYFHVNMKTGRFYTLQDLFKKDSNYLKIIRDIVNRQMDEKKKSGDSMYFDEPVGELQIDQQFIITENGLKILFQPYEVAPYAAGFQEFNIPYSDVGDIIDKSGEFWNSFGRNNN